MKDEAEERAEQVIRQVLVPLYPPEKPISEMSPYEQGFFRLWVPAVAAALREAQGERDAWQEDARRYAQNVDAAYVRGLERAASVLETAFNYDGGLHAIQAEIETSGRKLR